VRRISWAEQRRLEELVRGWVRDEDMHRSENLWVRKAIRNFPEAVEESVARMWDLQRTRPNYFKDHGHKIRVLVIDLAKTAGVKSWAQVRPGPEPI
jgi:hypothetical protein